MGPISNSPPTGHKSRAIFDRYNIIHEQELLEAGDQLVKYLAQQAQATPRGLNPGFSERIGNSRRTGAAVCCAAIARSNVGVSAFANIVATVREWFSSLAHLRRKVPPAVLFAQASKLLSGLSPRGRMAVSHS